MVLDETGGLVSLPQPPLAHLGQVPDEREGGVSDKTGQV